MSPVMTTAGESASWSGDRDRCRVGRTG
jgi:hypothetical protein